MVELNYIMIGKMFSVKLEQERTGGTLVHTGMCKWSACQLLHVHVWPTAINVFIIVNMI